jgi:hypothetical protein
MEGVMEVGVVEKVVPVPGRRSNRDRGWSQVDAAEGS